MYLVLDREFISKTELRGSVYRLPVWVIDWATTDHDPIYTRWLL